MQSLPYEGTHYQDEELDFLDSLFPANSSRIEKLGVGCLLLVFCIVGIGANLFYEAREKLRARK